MTDPDREFHVAGERLGAALLGVIEPWVMRCAARVGLDPSGREAVETATACREWLEPRLLGLLEADVDAQTTTPLTLARAASAFPTELAQRQGIVAPMRSPDDAQRFPDDLYGFAPATWADVDETLSEVGLRWSVAKALAHRHRHRPTEGAPTARGP